MIIKVLGHPRLPHLVASAGRDGRVILWDIAAGRAVQEFVVKHENSQQPIDVLDASFSPTGSHLVVTDLWGHWTLFGVGAAETYAQALPWQFFNIDTAPMLR